MSMLLVTGVKSPTRLVCLDLNVKAENEKAIAEKSMICRLRKATAFKKNEVYLFHSKKRGCWMRYYGLSFEESTKKCYGYTMDDGVLLFKSLTALYEVPDRELIVLPPSVAIYSIPGLHPLRMNVTALGLEDVNVSVKTATEFSFAATKFVTELVSKKCVRVDNKISIGKQEYSGEVQVEFQGRWRQISDLLVENKFAKREEQPRLLHHDVSIDSLLSGLPEANHDSSVASSSSMSSMPSVECDVNPPILSPHQREPVPNGSVASSSRASTKHPPVVMNPLQYSPEALPVEYLQPRVLVLNDPKRLLVPLLTFLSDRLHPILRGYFSNKDAQTLLWMQCTLLPAMLQGHNVLAVAQSEGNRKRGKSSSIVCALLQRIFERKESTKKQSSYTETPDILTHFLVCASWRKAQALYRLAQDILAFRERQAPSGTLPPVRVCLLYAGQQTESARQQLMNWNFGADCDLCIATPGPLLRLMEDDPNNDFPLLSMRHSLASLVLDDLDEMCADGAFLAQVQRIMLLRHQALVFLSQDADRLADPSAPIVKRLTDVTVIDRTQLVATATRFTPPVKSFLKKHLNGELELWQTSMESSLRFPIKHFFIESPRGMPARLTRLCELLTELQGDRIPGVVCVNDAEYLLQASDPFYDVDDVEEGDVYAKEQLRPSARIAQMLRKTHSGRVAYLHQDLMPSEVEAVLKEIWLPAVKSCTSSGSIQRLIVPSPAPLLVLTDDVLPSCETLLRLGCAKFIIHWNLPEDAEIFGSRLFTCFRDTMLQHQADLYQETECEPDVVSLPRSFFLYDSSEEWWLGVRADSFVAPSASLTSAISQMRGRRIRLLRQMRDHFMRSEPKAKTIHNLLAQQLEIMQMNREHEMVAMATNNNTGETKPPLCPWIKAYGVCRIRGDATSCEKGRHEVWPHLDDPRTGGMNHWPITGTVEFRVLNVLAANHFFVQLLSLQSGEETFTYPRNLSLLTMGLSLHFSIPENHTVLRPVDLHEGCVLVWCEPGESRIYERCRIIKVIPAVEGSRTNNRYHFDICLLDARGGTEVERVTVDQLRPLPQQFDLQHFPLQSVEMFVVNMQPVDRDLDFLPEANERVRNMLDNQNLFGLVVMSLRGTLWVDQVSHKVSLPGNKTLEVHMQQLQRTLIRENLAIANPDHFLRLQQLCAGRVDVPQCHVNLNTSAVHENDNENASSPVSSFLTRHFTYPEDAPSGNEVEFTRRVNIPTLPTWCRDETERCVVNHIVSLSEMYVCPDESWDTLWDLVAEMGEHHGAFRPLGDDSGSDRKDPYVAAGVTNEVGDCQWLRAKLMESVEAQAYDENGHQVTRAQMRLFLIDLGETITVRWKRQVQLRQLPCEFRQLPIQARRCSLAYGFEATEPLSSSLRKVISEEFFGPQNSIADVRCLEDCGEVPLVDLCSPTDYPQSTIVSLGEYLIAMGHATGLYNRLVLANQLFPTVANKRNLPALLQQIRIPSVEELSFRVVSAEEADKRREHLTQLETFFKRRFHLSLENGHETVAVLVKLMKCLVDPVELRYVYRCLLHVHTLGVDLPITVEPTTFIPNETVLRPLQEDSLCLTLLLHHLQLRPDDVDTCILIVHLLNTFEDLFSLYILAHATSVSSALQAVMNYWRTWQQEDLVTLLDLVLKVVSVSKQSFVGMLKNVSEVMCEYTDVPVLKRAMELIERIIKQVQSEDKLDIFLEAFWPRCVALQKMGLLHGYSELSRLMVAIINTLWREQLVDEVRFFKECTSEEELREVVKKVQSRELHSWFLGILQRTLQGTPCALPSVPQPVVQSKVFPLRISRTPPPSVTNLVLNSAQNVRVVAPERMTWCQTRDWILVTVRVKDGNLMETCPVTVTAGSLHLRLKTTNPNTSETWVAFDMILGQQLQDDNGAAVKCGDFDIRIRMRKLEATLWQHLLGQDRHKHNNYLSMDADRIYSENDMEHFLWQPDTSQSFFPTVLSFKKKYLYANARPDDCDVDEWDAAGRPQEELPENMLADTNEGEEEHPADEGVTKAYDTDVWN